MRELDLHESLAECARFQCLGTTQGTPGPRAMFTWLWGSPLPWLLSVKLSSSSWRDTDEFRAAQVHHKPVEQIQERED